MELAAVVQAVSFFVINNSKEEDDVLVVGLLLLIIPTAESTTYRFRGQWRVATNDERVVLGTTRNELEIVTAANASTT